MTGADPHPGRIARLRSALGRRGPSAILVTHLPNVRWLCGFTGSAGALLVTRRDAAFFTDFRYREQAGREVSVARRVEYARGATESLAAEVKRLRLSGLGFEADRMTVAFHNDLKKSLSKCELIPLTSSVERLRAIKDPHEVNLIRGAIAVAAKALKSGTKDLVGRSERAVRDRIEAAIRRHGGDDPSFPTIVAGGPTGALPHASPGSREIRGGDLVVVDFGVRLGGYCCDITRTFSPSKWENRAKDIYSIVLKAQQAAIAAVRPGIKAADVDAAAREVIAGAGFGESFGHGTGHGVGIEVHEMPALSPRSGDILEPGMVATIEPGIYVEDFGGVRIEDMVLVTKSGCEVLSRRIPKLSGR